MHAGIPPEHAAQSARHLVLCDLRGVETHGITRLSALAQRIRNGVVNAGREHPRRAPTCRLCPGER